MSENGEIMSNPIIAALKRVPGMQPEKDVGTRSGASSKEAIFLKSVEQHIAFGPT